MQSSGYPSFDPRGAAQTTQLEPGVASSLPKPFQSNLRAFSSACLNFCTVWTVDSDI